MTLILSSPAHSGERFNRRTPVVVAAEKVGPAVVNIFTEEVGRTRRNPFRGFGESPFDWFFRDFFPPADNQRRSLGSGVIIDRQGHILTNEHVIAGASRINVILSDQREFDGHLIGADIKSDLAIIKIDSKDPLPFVEMGRSSDLMIGETVLAIGNPFGLQQTVTTGIISALNRTIRAGENQVYHDFIQVDASINPGNSGGPLLNINGSLIGINTAIYQKAEGIGFAIPIDSAKRVVKELIRFGKVRRGWVGLSVKEIDPDRGTGVQVKRVFPGSPADRAGVRPGDRIVAIDKHEVQSKQEYRERITSYAVGNTVQFELVRARKTLTVPVKLGTLSKRYAAEFAEELLGLRVQNITPRHTRKFRLTTRQGVVVMEVDPAGVSGRVGFQPGDVILRVNQNPIQNEEDFSKALVEAENRSSVVLLVQRGRYGYYVTLEL